MSMIALKLTSSCFFKFRRYLVTLITNIPVLQDRDETLSHYYSYDRQDYLNITYSVGVLFLCTSHFLQQVHPCLISNLLRLQIAPINFFIGVCIPSLSDAFGCNLFEHLEDNLFIIILLHI